MASPVAQIVPSVTLFLPHVPDGGVQSVAQSVTELLRDLGLPVQTSAEQTAETTRFTTSGPDVVVTLLSEPMDPKETDACERPEYGQALDQYALRKLETHRAVIGITVEDTRGKAEARSRQALALTLRLARGLIGETGADLVLWAQTRVLYTVGEFSGLGQPARQRRPLVTPRGSAPTTSRPDLTGADAAFASAASTAGSAEALRRQVDALAAAPQGEGLRRRVEDLAAPLHAEALRREAGPSLAAPSPAAAAQSPVSAAPVAFAHDEMSEASAPRRAPPARLTLMLRFAGRQMDRWLGPDGRPTVKMQVAVYLMTAAVALLSLPIGLALLAYNILRRESLRVTLPALLLVAAASASGMLAQLDAFIRQLLG